MEFFRNPNIDFLGKKWYFLAFSLVFSVAGVFSMLFWHGVPLGVDFRGGTLVYVKFSHPPNDNAIHEALRKVGLTQAKIQRLGVVTNNEVLIDLDVRETSEKALDQGKVQIINALETNAPAGKPIGWQSEADWRANLDLLKETGDIDDIKPLSSYFTNAYLQ